jgi:hypothetical protein
LKALIKAIGASKPDVYVKPRRDHVGVNNKDLWLGKIALTIAAEKSLCKSIIMHTMRCFTGAIVAAKDAKRFVE